MGCHFLLQGNFLTQGLNPCRLQADSLPLSHQGSWPHFTDKKTKEKQNDLLKSSQVIKQNENRSLNSETSVLSPHKTASGKKIDKIKNGNNTKTIYVFVCMFMKGGKKQRGGTSEWYIN